MAKKPGIPGELLYAAAAVGLAKNKFAALAGVLKDVAGYKLFGWLPAVLGGLKGMEGLVRGILRDTGSLAAALERLRMVQSLTREFAALQGSVSAASRRVAELIRFAASQPMFGFSEVGKASKELEILTRGAFAGEDALRLLGDSSAKSGTDFGALAGKVGDFHRQLAGGEPVRNTAQELAAMGVISQETAAHLATMQENGAGMNQVFSALTSELAKAQGAMQAHASTVDGVTAAYEKSREALAQKFGEPFKEAEIQRMKDATAALHAISEPVEQLAQFLNGLLSPVENIGTSVAGWLGKMGALTAIFGIVITAVKGLTVGLIALAVGLSAKPIGTFIASLFGAAAATNKTQAAFAALRTSAGGLLAAFRALTAGNLAAAGAHVKAAGSAAMQAGMLGILKLAAVGASVAVRTLGKALLIGYALEGLQWLWDKGKDLIFAESAKKTASALREQADAHRKVRDALEEQISKIENLDDAQAALLKTTEELLASQHRLVDLDEKKRRGEKIKNEAGEEVDVSEAMIRQERRSFHDLNRRQLRLRGEIDSGMHGVTIAQQQQREQKAERELVLEQIARENAIERATGAQKIALMMAERDRLVGLVTEGELTQRERGELDAREKTNVAAAGGGRISEAMREEAALARRRAQSPIIRDEQRLQDMLRRGGQTQASQALDADLRRRKKKTETDLNSNQRAAAEIQSQIEKERTAVRLTQVQLGVEREVAMLRDRGFDREEADRQARIDGLYDEAGILRGAGRDDEAEAVQYRIAGEERALRLAQERARLEREATAARVRVLEAESRAAALAAQGRFAEADSRLREAQRIKDAEEDKANRDRYLDVMSPEQADEQVEADREVRNEARAAHSAAFLATKMRELEEGRLAASNRTTDQRRLISMRNEDAFRQAFGEASAALGPGRAAEAAGLAFAQVRQMIEANAEAPAVSALARVGGGGGVSDPLISVAEQQRDLQARMLETLQQIAAQGEGGEITRPDVGEIY